MDIEEQYDKIFHYCYYRIRDKNVAEDITQEVFLRFYNSNYVEQQKEIRYLYTIAVSYTHLTLPTKLEV